MRNNIIAGVISGLIVAGILWGISLFKLIPIPLHGLIILSVFICIIVVCVLLLIDRNKKIDELEAAVKKLKPDKSYEYEKLEYILTFKSRTEMLYEKRVRIKSLTDNLNKEEERKFNWSGNRIEQAFYQVEAEDKKPIVNIVVKTFNPYTIEFDNTIKKDEIRNYLIQMNLFDENEEMETRLNHFISIKVKSLVFKVRVPRELKITNVKGNIYSHYSDTEATSSELVQGKVSNDLIEYNHEVKNPELNFRYTVTWIFDEVQK